MTQVGIVVVVLVIMVVCGLSLASGQAVDRDEAADYQSLQESGSSMSRSNFRAIRAKNKKEAETFGDGRHAPSWPSRKLNGHYTLHRGVWVEDGVPVPSNRKLDEIREAHKTVSAASNPSSVKIARVVL